MLVNQSIKQSCFLNTIILFYNIIFANCIIISESNRERYSIFNKSLINPLLEINKKEEKSSLNNKYSEYLKSIIINNEINNEINKTGEVDLKDIFINEIKIEEVKPFNFGISNIKDSNEEFNITMKSYKDQFSLIHPNGTFKEFKKLLLETINIHRCHIGPNRDNNNNYLSIINTEPLPLKMTNNTCFLISLLHIIKTNKPLQGFILNNCNSNDYKNILIKLLNQESNEISDEDYIKIAPFDELYNPEKLIFPRGVQGDPIEFLAKIFTEKCNLSGLQFFLFNNFNLISINEEFKPFFTSSLVPEFISYLSDKSFPIINLSINYKNVINPFNIQDILYGTKYEYNNLFINSNCYSIPLFLNSPPFLIINIEYQVKYNNNNSEYIKHFPLIFQDWISLRSLEDDNKGYYLTGFILNESKYSNNTHYIPFYLFNNKWYSYYYNKRSEDHYDFNFPLIMEYNELYRIKALFYAKAI